MYRRIITLSLSIVMFSCQEKATLKVEKYPNGNVKSEAYFVKDSIKHGVDKGYYLDGKLKAEVNYTRNKKNGLARYFFPDGKLKAEVHYIDDLLDGETKWYYSNGQLEIQGLRIQGKEYGSTFFYYDHGELEAYQCLDFEGNVIYLMKFDKSGRVIKQEGVVFSPSIKLSPSDSSRLKVDEPIVFQITVAQPPGYTVTVWTRDLSTDKASERVSHRVENSTVTVKKAFHHTGQQGLIVVGELRDKSGAVAARDSVVRILNIHGEN